MGSMSAARPSLPSRVRVACAEVAARARHVTIDHDRLGDYARSFPSAADVPSLDPAAHLLSGERDDVAAFVLCNNAINFGSGWWPTIRKRDGLSGYLTIATALADRFRARGPWPPGRLAQLTTEELAATLGQDPGHELMSLYRDSLRDLATHIEGEAGGRWTGVVDAASGSAVALAERLAHWDCFADVSHYEELEVPIYKRAQLTAADLQLAGVTRFADQHELTVFADNLIPHVLSVDGILLLDPDLHARIDRGQLLDHDTPEEVELRACTIHAVELLADAVDRALSPAQIDMVLWTRGRQPRYKSRPRPRARTTAY